MKSIRTGELSLTPPSGSDRQSAAAFFAKIQQRCVHAEIEKVPLVVGGSCGPWARGPRPAITRHPRATAQARAARLRRRSSRMAIILLAMVGSLICMGATRRRFDRRLCRAAIRCLTEDAAACGLAHRPGIPR